MSFTVDRDDVTCDWENGLKVNREDGSIYETNNPLIKGPVLLVTGTTIMGMFVGAGVGFSAPFYITGRLGYLGTRALYRANASKFPIPKARIPNPLHRNSLMK